ncbi:tetratricopeptide repeat protein [bacterium]|nr:tetratricopeptide repeat protein [bacterium]
MQPLDHTHPYYRSSANLLESLSIDRELVSVEIYGVNDFYGHATQMKQFLGLPPNHKLKFILAHGVVQHKRIWEIKVESPLPVFLCPSAEYANLFQEAVGKIAFGVGPMLYYVPGFDSALPLPEEKTLVVFPDHSTHYQTTDYNFDRIEAVIQSQASRFERIRICLYWKDILLGHHLYYLDQGYEVTSAGHMFDPYFIRRLIQIIGSATETIAFSVSTNMSYSVAMNRPIWITDGDSKRQYKDEQTREQFIDYWDDAKAFRDEAEALFSDPVDKITTGQREFIARVAGLDCRRSKEELLNIHQAAEEIFKRKIQFPLKRGYKAPDPSASFQGLNVEKSAAQKNPTTPQPSPRQVAAQLFRDAMRKSNSGQYEDALPFLERALVMFGESPQEGTNLLKAFCLSKLNRFDEAFAAVQNELRLFPKNEGAQVFFQQLQGIKRTESGGEEEK